MNRHERRKGRATDPKQAAVYRLLKQMEDVASDGGLLTIAPAVDAEHGQLPKAMVVFGIEPAFVKFSSHLARDLAQSFIGNPACIVADVEWIGGALIKAADEADRQALAMMPVEGRVN